MVVGGEKPHVLVIIPAYNESESLERKLENTLALRYTPKTIVVVDDHSTDSTYETARRFADRGVRVLRNAMAPGKNNAVATAARAVPSDLICLTDADVLAPPDTLDILVAHLSDSVGVVCGKQGYLTQRQWEQGELRSAPLDLVDGFYHLIRMLQTKVDSVVGPHGQLLLARRRGDDWIPAGIRCDDVELALRLRAEGLRTRYVPATQFFERRPDERVYYRQRYRRGQAVQASLLRHWRMLLNPRYGLFGVVCFPLEFALYVVQPVALLLAMTLLLAPALPVLTSGVKGAALLTVLAGVVALPATRQYLVINGLLLWGLLATVMGRRPRDRWRREEEIARK